MPRRDRAFERLTSTSRSYQSCAIDGIYCSRELKAVLNMMRPDHIYFAMAMVKHSTLAGACIFAAKLVYFMLKASA
jgi:hypothetical protein